MLNVWNEMLYIKQQYPDDLGDLDWLEHRNVSRAISASKEFEKLGISMDVHCRWGTAMKEGELFHSKLN